jgi:hypothetical protein
VLLQSVWLFAELLTVPGAGVARQPCQADRRASGGGEGQSIDGPRTSKRTVAWTSFKTCDPFPAELLRGCSGWSVKRFEPVPGFQAAVVAAATDGDWKSDRSPLGGELRIPSQI